MDESNIVEFAGRDAISDHVWMAPAGKGFSVDAGVISVAAMYTASGEQYGDCAP